MSKSTAEKPKADKKSVQRLQRAIVDGLEAVKAQELHVYDTEALSALFERIVIASGASSRQTQALAASVRDAVREAGFAKPRIEGAENGEWVIVDCGQIVVHIMQPAIRQYYRLEELWGEKPMRARFGATRPVVAAGGAGRTSRAAAVAKVPTTQRSRAKGPATKTASADKVQKPAVKAVSQGRVRTRSTGGAGEEVPERASAVRRRAPVKKAVGKKT